MGLGNRKGEGKVGKEIGQRGEWGWEIGMGTAEGEGEEEEKEMERKREWRRGNIYEWLD